MQQKKLMYLQCICNISATNCRTSHPTHKTLDNHYFLLHGIEQSTSALWLLQYDAIFLSSFAFFSFHIYLYIKNNMQIAKFTPLMCNSNCQNTQHPLYSLLDVYMLFLGGKFLVNFLVAKKSKQKRYCFLPLTHCDICDVKKIFSDIKIYLATIKLCFAI